MKIVRMAASVPFFFFAAGGIFQNENFFQKFVFSSRTSVKLKKRPRPPESLRPNWRLSSTAAAQWRQKHWTGSGSARRQQDASGTSGGQHFCSDDD